MSDIDSIHGQQFVFGLRAADTAGFSVTGFFPRGISSNDIEPEVFAKATNGEGSVEAIAITAQGKKKLTVAVMGYIDSSFSRLSVTNSFTLFGRFFLITKISDPRQKGDFIEVTIDAESHINVTS